MNILSRFEKLYKRYGSKPENTKAICNEIARDEGFDYEAVADYIHIYRYEEDAPAFIDWFQNWGMPTEE